MFLINPGMKKTFTPEDLVRFIYRETSPEETTAIKKAITDNTELAQIYHALLTANEELNNLSLEPSSSSINVILQHSRNSVKTETH